MAQELPETGLIWRFEANVGDGAAATSTLGV
jgi:hypothetical protein